MEWMVNKNLTLKKEIEEKERKNKAINEERAKMQRIE